jgi:hypothetical protein
MSLPVRLSRQEIAPFFQKTVSGVDGRAVHVIVKMWKANFEGKRLDHAADFQATGGVADRFDPLRSACQQGAAMTGQQLHACMKAAQLYHRLTCHPR